MYVCINAIYWMWVSARLCAFMYEYMHMRRMCAYACEAPDVHGGRIPMYVCMYMCICMYICDTLGVADGRACMYVCMHVFIYVCAYVCMYVYSSLDVSDGRGLFVCMYVCMCASAYVCIYEQREMCMRILKCIHVRMYVCMDLHMHAISRTNIHENNVHTYVYLSRCVDVYMNVYMDACACMCTYMHV